MVLFRRRSQAAFSKHQFVRVSLLFALAFAIAIRQQAVSLPTLEVLSPIRELAQLDAPKVDENHVPDQNRDDTTYIIDALTQRMNSELLKRPKVYVLCVPELTTDLLQKDPSGAENYYASYLNEESAEVWLYRGLEASSMRTDDPSEADVFVIGAFLHYHHKVMRSMNNNELAKLIASKVIDSSKPHLWLVPTFDPPLSDKIGLVQSLAELRAKLGDNLYSVGLERNERWQRGFVGKEALSRIVPIPYVLRPKQTRQELEAYMTEPRSENFVFFAGDARHNAIPWSGCNRTALTEKLVNTSEIPADVRIVTKNNRISQELYNQRMIQSEYCLVLCGDTPTSRSMTSAMASGCLPIRVGSRWSGKCEAPCHLGTSTWKSWTFTDGVSHFPFSQDIPWDEFPEVNEAAFIEDPVHVLKNLFQEYDGARKHKLREHMRSTQLQWIYGWGDPTTSTEFGGAADAVLMSFFRMVEDKGKTMQQS